MESSTTWSFPIDPVPAARIKQGRYGAYYPKTYEAFRRTARELVKKVVGKWKPVACALALEIIFLREQPKKTEREYPRGDVDNYSKSILDSLNEVAWNDDDQIVELHAYKRWADKGQPGSILVNIGTPGLVNLCPHCGKAR